MVMVVLLTIVSMLNTPSVADDSGDDAARVTERLRTLYQKLEEGSDRIGNVLEEEGLKDEKIHEAMKNAFVYTVPKLERRPSDHCPVADRATLPFYQ